MMAMHLSKKQKLDADTKNPPKNQFHPGIQKEWGMQQYFSLLKK